MGRAPCCEKTGLKRGKWAAEEDEKLVNYVKANGEGLWRSLPKNAGLLRCGKSCRLRWINYLREDVKRGNFTADEEETIVKLHKNLGNRWSLIASHLPGRTDNEIKNYWTSHLSRRLYSFRSIANAHFTSSEADIIQSVTTTAKKKPAGRVSRAIAKKYNRNAVGNHAGAKETAPDIPPPARMTDKTESDQPNHYPRERNVDMRSERVVAGVDLAQNNEQKSEGLIESCSSLSSCDLSLYTDGEEGWTYNSNDAFMPGPWDEEVDEETLMTFKRFMEENEGTKRCENISIDDDVRDDRVLVNNNTDSGTATSDHHYKENGNFYACSSPIVSFLSDEVFSWGGGASEEVVDLWSEEEECIWIWS